MTVDRNVRATDHATIHEHARVQGWSGEKGGRPDFEVRAGDSCFWREDRWVQIHRWTDWKNDWYDELVTDPATGEIIHECHEPLSEHTSRGSAKGATDPG
jgi:hypothetical protein